MNADSATLGNLGKASVSAVKWSAFATVGRFALQLLAQVVLARLLGPDNYGLFGIGMVVYTFGNFFASFGFGRNLMQQPTIDAHDIRFALTWQLLTGGTATLCIFLLAPTLAAYFNEPRVEPVIAWLSLACLINSATAPASNLLQRNLDFKAYGLAQMLSYALGYLGIGIPLALAGYGVAALVAAWLVQLAALMLACYWLHPHPLKPLLWFPGARAAFSFGGAVFVTNIVNWLLNNIDRIVIGRVLNAQSVGLYTAGYNLATLPNALLLNTLQSVLFASSARLQSDRERLAAGYRQIFSAVWVLLLPAFVFLACLAPALVALLYGPRWSDSAHVLSVLFLAMPAFIVWGLSTPVLWNTGRKQFECLLQLPIALAGIAALFALAHLGIVAVAVTAAAILCLRGLFIAAAALRALELRPRELLPALGRGLLLSLLAAACAQLCIRLAAPLDAELRPLLTLLASGLLGGTLFALIVFGRPALLGAETRALLARFLPRLGGARG